MTILSHFVFNDYRCPSIHSIAYEFLHLILNSKFLNSYILCFSENRLLSFTGHTKLGPSAKYSDYFTPEYALKVGNFLYPSFYVRIKSLVEFFVK